LIFPNPTKTKFGEKRLFNSSFMTIAQALWYTAPHQAEIIEETLPTPLADDCQVRSVYSGLSRGTETLVASGRVPESEYERMRAPFMGGVFPFPVKYGYANVGVVEHGPDPWVGQMVFSLSPHQSVFFISPKALMPIGQLSPQRALLAANMETALNAVWNGAPGPADRIAVVGGGVVGLLAGYLCAKIPGTEVLLVDINPKREHEAQKLGMSFVLPNQAPDNCDLVIHASGASAGLNTAIGLAGEEATVLELSWFGAGPASVALGGAFHSKQLKLVASQVGHMAPSHRARWDYSRRLAAAIALLDDPVLDILVERPIALDQICGHLPTIFDSDSGVLCQPISY
jgi:NADPH:quinone reductase-like Zn-dependent oxidoreductase